MTADPDRLRASIEPLAAMERLATSEGEREAARLIAGELAALGFRARVEEAPALGNFTLPIGLMAALAGAAGLAAPRRTAVLAGTLATLGVIDDVAGGPQRFRRMLPRRTTWNVVAEAGDPQAQSTLVVCAHHDAARGGLIYHPGLNRWVADRFPDWYAGQETSPQLMRLVASGPGLLALGAATGIRALRTAGTAIAVGTAAVMADIASRPVVPGANDNLSAVAALLELARVLRDEPPRGLRVLLLSTGSEESFLEGMRGFLAAHGTELPAAGTRFVVLEALGSPELILLEGEGMLRMRDYSPALKELLAQAGEDAGRPLRRRLRTGLASDALLPLMAGYQTACIASCDEYKMAANYHLPTDTPERVSWDTVAGAVEVLVATVRRLSAQPNAAPARA